MKKYLFILLALSLGPRPAAAEAPLELYIDADYSINEAAAEAIELGVRTALLEAENTLGGRPVVIAPMDHRGNVRRSRDTMDQFLKSPSAIALIGGLHSPPYLTHQRFINQSGILTLLPWSAAGPITRAAADDENWIFRLSVDDYRSGPFLVHEAVQGANCKDVALILLNTGWGRASEITLAAALNAAGRQSSITAFFPATLGQAGAGALAQSILQARPDCAILLANARNGALIVNALADRGANLRLFSHWGITGSTAFINQVGHDARRRLGITVLQTCGLKREAEENPVLRTALAVASPDQSSLARMSAPAGFVHGYDLTKILVSAARQAARTPQWNGDIANRRRALRHALENLDHPVDGILKRYETPFGAYSEARPFAHEALGPDDLCLARFTEDGYLEHAD